jgi:hypothetical protein
MMQSEHVLLSLLGPRPVFWYEEQIDEVFCAWNGIKMTQSHALMQISSFFWGANPTPEMRRAADSHFYFLWAMGAFENSESWKSIIERNMTDSTMHGWYKRKLKPVYEKHLQNVTPGEAYNWLSLKDCYKPINT